MPELGTGATPAVGRIGTSSASGPEAAEGLALAFDFGTRRIGVAVGGPASASA
jgi:hypothetical protein